MKRYYIDSELIEVIKIIILNSYPVQGGYSNRDVLNVINKLSSLDEEVKETKESKKEK